MRLGGKYGTNHPKDRAAKRMQEMARLIKEQGCTNRDLREPTEQNIQKCMKEMQYTAKMGEQFKKDGKFLGENTNVNKYRR